MTLNAWLQKEGMSQRQFSRLIGWPEGPVSRYLAGKRRPGVDHALAIERATRGEVPMSVWARDQSKIRPAVKR